MALINEEVIPSRILVPPREVAKKLFASPPSSRSIDRSSGARIAPVRLRDLDRDVRWVGETPD